MFVLYLTFFLVGLVFLGLALFGADTGHDALSHIDLGHFGHADIGHAGDVHGAGHHETSNSPRLLSIRIIAAFILGFGMTGLVCLYLGKPMSAQLLYGFISGFVIAGVAYLIMWLMYSQQAGSPQDATTFIGKSGLITTGSSQQGIGEVRVDNKYYTCREKSGKLLQLNQVVKVDSAETGLLIVETI